MQLTIEIIYTILNMKITLKRGAKMKELQQKLAETTNVVMDGRDIGTVVLPNAQVKVYLTASVEVRANRRYKELIEKGQEADLEKIKKEQLRKRIDELINCDSTAQRKLLAKELWEEVS